MDRSERVVDVERAQRTEFVLRGGKAIRFVAVAIQHEIARLGKVADDDRDEDAQADALNDIGFYQAILSDMAVCIEGRRKFRRKIRAAYRNMRGAGVPSDQNQATDAVIGIEAIKALYVNGTAQISCALERLFNGDKAEIDRVATLVGRAARVVPR